jgi:hypothetical protein
MRRNTHTTHINAYTHTYTQAVHISSSHFYTCLNEAVLASFNPDSDSEHSQEDSDSTHLNETSASGTDANSSSSFGAKHSKSRADQGVGDTDAHMVDSDSDKNIAEKAEEKSAGKAGKTGSQENKKRRRKTNVENDQNSVLDKNMDIHDDNMRADNTRQKELEPTVPMMIEGQEVQVPVRAVDPDYRMSVREEMEHADLCVGRILVSEGDHLCVDVLGVPAGVVMSGDCCAHGAYVCVYVCMYGCVCW